MYLTSYQFMSGSTHSSSLSRRTVVLPSVTRKQQVRQTMSYIYLCIPYTAIHDVLPGASVHHKCEWILLGRVSPCYPLGAVAPDPLELPELLLETFIGHDPGPHGMDLKEVRREGQVRGFIRFQHILGQASACMMHARGNGT